MKDVCCDSDDNNVTLFTVITFYTCQAGVDTEMTVCMFLCMTQNEEICTVVSTIGTFACLSIVQTTLNEDDLDNTLKSGDQQISMKETCGLCEGSA